MKVKIKQTKANLIYMLIGRLTTYIAIEIALYKILILILDNCITTI